MEMERAKMAEYVELLNRPFSLIWRNILVAGRQEGVGIAIGFTFFAATILYMLQLLGALNLPIVGDYIADIVRIVQHQLGRAALINGSAKHEDYCSGSSPWSPSSCSIYS